MSSPAVAAATVAAADPGNPWFSARYLQDNADTILAALREHAVLTTQAVVLAVLVAVPLAVAAYWWRRLSGPVLATAGVLYTIPSLALFAFVAPVLGTGTRTVLLGLVVYALLVVVRSTLVGLHGVPDDVRDAARGMGYGRLAMLLRVELPLALPAVLTGVRLATVSTVALVTIGVLVGHGGLGQLILGGFRNNFYRAEILTGTLLCVLLALALDVVLALVARAVTPWTHGRAGAA